MVQQSAPPGIWDEAPAGASILLATGRARHDLLVIAEPAFLRDLDQARCGHASAIYIVRLK